METAVLWGVGVACVVAALVWARSAQQRRRLIRHIEADVGDEGALALARSNFDRDVHTGVLYALLGAAVITIGVTDERWATLALAAVALPALASISRVRHPLREARMARHRFDLERRARDVLAQQQLAPRAWADRLAPDELPDITGFQIGRAYQAGTGLMAGDFYDVFRIGRTRIAAVIGDVSGHGIESSITAFQAKSLLRVLLRQFRDPAQALEELNVQMSGMDRGEEFISACIVVFELEAGTVRFASAGHPTGFLWHQRDIQPLRATGPLLMLDPSAEYFSREIPLDRDDLVVLYTDGLSEARAGSDQFGESRIEATIRRDPTVAPDVLCKTLLETARDHATGPLADDVAILALRRD